MKRKSETKFENFDRVMDGLLAVPYKELQEKIEEEKKAKVKRKRNGSDDKENGRRPARHRQ